MEPDQAQITVLIADAQRLFSGALAHALSEFPKISVVQERPISGPGVVRAARKLRPDVVLLDYWMEGIASARRIVDEAPGSRVVFLSWIHGSEEVQEALEAGAVGFLPKSVGVDEVAEAILQAHSGEPLVYPEQLQDLVETIGRRDEQVDEYHKKLEALSPREFQIVILLSSGKLIQEVAKELDLTQNTITAHIGRILKKTGVRSHAEVLAMARAAGIIQT